MTNKLVLLFRPKAEKDLEQIFIYTQSTWGFELAEKYIDRLYSSMIQLLSYPKIGSKYVSSLNEYRKIVVDSHVIYYRLSDKEVLIVRILHSKMNRENFLD